MPKLASPVIKKRIIMTIMKTEKIFAIKTDPCNTLFKRLNSKKHFGVK